MTDTSPTTSTVTSVAARLAPGRTAPDADTGFTDLLTTPGARVTAVTFEPEGWLRVTFDRPVTTAEAAAVRRRVVSANAADEAARTQLEAFLDIAAPTRAQFDAQVKLLTRLAAGLTEQPPA